MSAPIIRKDYYQHTFIIEAISTKINYLRKIDHIVYGYSEHDIYMLVHYETSHKNEYTYDGKLSE